MSGTRAAHSLLSLACFVGFPPAIALGGLSFSPSLAAAGASGTPNIRSSFHRFPSQNINLEQIGYNIFLSFLGNKKTDDDDVKSALVPAEKGIERFAEDVKKD